MTEQILTAHRPTRQWTGPRSDTLADVLERVLDKGVVIVGDVVVSVLDVELLTLRLRLFIASADTAREMGLDWWLNDPFFSSRATRAPERDPDALADENRRLRERLDALERAVGSRPEASAALPSAETGASAADVLATRAGGRAEEPVGATRRPGRRTEAGRSR
ncbi:gas vesicle protein [Frankia sp. CN7]|uniref:Gas vesicle protein n=2 Tax=Frankia nepalensis TaxID=1836974 RepID=A0A937RA86_9ACTN|nr:gas vesicle protein [Frankia nepalensis]MBL7496594.1 gas vesicle protein [Frankia nepalensis]MBL7626602.1 gas vesicle protein [Frankia nepalensis]